MKVAAFEARLEVIKSSANRLKCYDATTDITALETSCLCESNSGTSKGGIFTLLVVHRHV